MSEAPAKAKLQHGSRQTADRVAAIVDGARRAISDALSLCERANAETSQLMQSLRPHLRAIPVLGVTGPPGAGKSTLVNAIAETMRARTQDARIAILAIDPSSPISGGAILGDRLRMTAATADPNIFMRSLSAAGHLGGIAPPVARMIDVFDAAGFTQVIIETVGTGQSEIDVAQVGDVRLVVAAPGLGDDVQAMKSGLLEIADIIAVNKADRPGAEQTRQQLAGALSLRADQRDVPVHAVSALNRAGLNALCDDIARLMADTGTRDVIARRTGRARFLLKQSAANLIANRLGADTERDAQQTADAIAVALLDGAIESDEAVKRLLS